MKTIFFQVATFYKFIKLNDLEKLKKLFVEFLESQQIKGTVLLANEGINGTVAGNCSDISEFKSFLRKLDLLSDSNFKISVSQKEPFPRLKVKLKDEIVSIGNEWANPQKIVGQYLRAFHWHFQKFHSTEDNKLQRISSVG